LNSPQKEEILAVIEAEIRRKLKFMAGRAEL
jgi:hypothetical protein